MAHEEIRSLAALADDIEISDSEARLRDSLRDAIACGRKIVNERDQTINKLKQDLAFTHEAMQAWKQLAQLRMLENAELHNRLSSFQS